MDAITRDRAEFGATLQTIAQEVAARHADDVDRQARFPVEVIDALRRAKLLSAPVPVELGGSGLGLTELGGLCAILAETCASSAMVLAMHYNQVAALTRHAEGHPTVQAWLRRIAEHEWLVASITSEVGVWGDMRRSLCAVEPTDDGALHLVKEATTGSYCDEADVILVTARRHATAAENDQVWVALRRDEVQLTRTTTWDSLGMRGTCSPGFHVEARFDADAIVPVPYAVVSACSVLPCAHLLWSALWSGIAAGAYAKAARYVRSVARKQPGQVPVIATHLSVLGAQLQLMRTQWQAVARDVDAEPDVHALDCMGWSLRLNHVKTSSAEMAPQIVHGALQIVGIQGYKNDSPLSLGRAYRDALSATLMIANDRIHARNAAMLLVHKDTP